MIIESEASRGRGLADEGRICSQQELRVCWNEWFIFDCGRGDQYMSCVKKTIYYVHRRLCASNIMRSTSQLPIPGPPRREREGSTRFCRDFKLALSDGSAIENVRLVLLVAVVTAGGGA